MLGPGLDDGDLRAQRLHLAALAESDALVGADPAEIDHGGDEPGRRSEEEWVRRFMEEFDAEELPGEESSQGHENGAEALTSDEKGA